MPTQTQRPLDEKYYELLSEQVSTDDFEFSADAVVTAGHGQQPRSDHLAPFMPTNELHAATRCGRNGFTHHR